MMRILMIESSPHKHGSSNLLAERFMEGAKEAGHQTEVFDAARANLHPCLGCDACGMAGPCGTSFWRRICWYLSRRSTILACPPS